MSPINTFKYRAARPWGELFGMLRSGQLAATIAASVPMARGAEAHRMLESRGTIGKVVLTIG